MFRSYLFFLFLCMFWLNVFFFNKQGFRMHVQDFNRYVGFPSRFVRVLCASMCLYSKCLGISMGVRPFTSG